ncbi:MAG: hypothetical protein RLY16_168 [Bacteroidota bacterium]|jgi:broad specificity phosphatase PhoE
MLLGYSQTSTTIILLRHAEKDTTVAGASQMQADPPLSEAGKARAEKLVKALAEFKVDHIFSTDFTRTKSTVTPLSQKTGKPIELYNHKALEAFADSIRNLRNQTIVIVGHSNTTPKLANLLLKKENFQPLSEAEYNKIFVVTIYFPGRPDAEVIEY